LHLRQPKEIPTQLNKDLKMNKKIVSLVSKKSKRIEKKIRFFTSRTGKFLDQNKRKNIRQFRKIKFLEDDSYILKDKRGLITQTIEQKNDNDVDSEKEIVDLGVQFLYKKLSQAIRNEQEKKKINERMQTRRIFKEKQKQIKNQQKRYIISRNWQIPDFFGNNSIKNFPTPNDRKISTNDASYISSIIQQNRKLSGCRLMNLWDSRKPSTKTTVRTNGQNTLDNKSGILKSINIKMNDFLKKSLNSNIGEETNKRFFNH
jgi:hypothetical protein